MVTSSDQQRQAISKVLIIGDGIALPIGWASTSRLKNIARSISNGTVSTEVLLVRPTEPHYAINNIDATGEFDEIPFIYLAGTPILSKFSLRRRIQMLFGHFGLIGNFLKNIKNNRSFAVIAYTRNVTTLLLISILCRIYKVPLVLELCEWPTTIPVTNKVVRANYYLFCRYLPSLVDGVITISKFIQDKIRSTSGKKISSLKLLNIPILVDCREFEGKRWDPNISEPYVLFCGSFTYQKTINLIINSFKYVSLSFPNYRLFLAGAEPVGNDYEKVRLLLEQLDLTDKVVFPGFVARPELLKLFSQSSALLIPMFNDEQSNARFPTKIAEYLMSGCPVVTTAVGEVDRYLRDQEHAFLANDDSAITFSRSIEESLLDPMRSRLVGERGRLHAIATFSYENYSHKIIRFISSIDQRIT